jgi:2Fe-2S ferredoxin
MTTIIFQQKNGENKSVDAENGFSLMVAAIENDIIGIKAVCNGCCNCGTCHVSIAPRFLEISSPMYSGEQQVLTQLQNSQATSRLACQVIVNDQLEGMVVIVE